jgi:hypothetical protein
MKLVDTAVEQDLLETIIEEAKPALPAEAMGLDYLLATPFRYYPLPPGSRFRASSDPGVFYGSDSVKTAAAEIGYWRWKFVQESEGLTRLGPAPHTAFSVVVKASGVDLRKVPFNSNDLIWRHPSDYSGTQEFARVAREAQIGIILYHSVRSREKRAWCGAVLTPLAFKGKGPDRDLQTWHLVVTKDEVIWRRGGGERLSIISAQWDS